MSMTLTDPVESGDNGDGDIGWSEVGSETGLSWAETLWGDGRLTYDGQDFSTLGSWAEVSNPAIGLGGGYYWDYDGATNTLAIEVAVISDPDASTVQASPASIHE